jgi:hypothetical protein
MKIFTCVRFERNFARYEIPAKSHSHAAKFRENTQTIRKISYRQIFFQFLYT